MGLFDFLLGNKPPKPPKPAPVRDIERTVDRLTDRINDLEKGKAKLWQAAKMKAAQGLKKEAARLLQQYKTAEVMISRLDKQVTFIQTKKTEIETAGVMAGGMAALEKLAKAAKLDPDAMMVAMDTVNETSETVNDMNKQIMREIMKDEEQQARAYEEQSEYTDGDDDLMAALEAEVAGDMGYVAGSGNGVGSKTENNIKQKLDN